MEIPKLRAGEFFPRIILPTISGIEIDVSEPYQDATWQIVIFYRGCHSQRCTDFLNNVEHIKDKLLSHGISVTAVSADDGEQLQNNLKNLQISFPVAFGLSIAQMHDLNLYISLPKDFNQTNHAFCEPGLFILNELGQIVVLDISNNEMCRPHLDTMLDGVIELKQSDEPLIISGSF